MLSVVIEVWEPRIVGYEWVESSEDDESGYAIVGVRVPKKGSWVPLFQMIRRLIQFGGGFANLFFPEEPQRGGGGGYGGGRCINNVPLYMRGPETGVESNGYERYMPDYLFQYHGQTLIPDYLSNSFLSFIQETCAPWMEIVYSQFGIRRTQSKQTSNPEILKYYSVSSEETITSEQTAWCAAFINWCFFQIGIEGSHSLVATDFQHYGVKLKQPAYGAIAVFIDLPTEKDPKPWTGHATFIAGRNKKGQLVYLGGNQSNAVGYSLGWAGSKRLIGYYFPVGYSPCYDLPFINFNGQTGGGTR